MCELAEPRFYEFEARKARDRDCLCRVVNSSSNDSNDSCCYGRGGILHQSFDWLECETLLALTSLTAQARINRIFTCLHGFFFLLPCRSCLPVCFLVTFLPQTKHFSIRLFAGSELTAAVSLTVHALQDTHTHTTAGGGGARMTENWAPREATCRFFCCGARGMRSVTNAGNNDSPK